MSTAHKIRRSSKPCHDMPTLRRCYKPQEITDEQIQDFERAMGQVGVEAGEGCEMKMRCFALKWNIIWVF